MKRFPEMVRFSLFFVVAAVLLTHGIEARACDDFVGRDRILGVAASGRFVIRSYGSGGMSCPINGFDIRNRHGDTIGTYVDGDGSGGARGRCQTTWTGQGVLPVPVVASETPASLERRLTRAMKLTPLKPSRRRVAVVQNLRTGYPCLQVHLISRRGRQLVWEAREGHRGACVPVSVSVAEHPRSPLLFFPYQQRKAGGCSIDEKSVHWVPLGVVKATTEARRAKRHLVAGRFAAAAAAAQRSLAHHPGLVPARLHLARALLGLGLSWPQAKQKLPKWRWSTHSCVGGYHWDWGQALSQSEFDAWQRHPGFEPWLRAQMSAHDQAHPGEDNPQGAWGPNRQ